jgi:hypothetical protein
LGGAHGADDFQEVNGGLRHETVEGEAGVNLGALLGGQSAKRAAGSAPAVGFGIAPALNSGDAFEVEAVAAFLRGLGGLEIGKEGDGFGLARERTAGGGKSARGDFAADGFDVGLKFHGEVRPGRAGARCGQSSSGIMTVMQGAGSSMSSGPATATNLTSLAARLSLRT